jgi:transcriptional regulator with XRE-family HTH domain
VLVGPTIRRRRLGTDLRRLRETRSLRLEDVASRLGVAPSTLSRIETGKAPTRTSYLAVLLDLYGVDDPAKRRQLTDLAREGQRRGWWAEYDDLLPVGAGTYLGLEAEASLIRSFSAAVLPDLLQTEGYAASALQASRPGLTPTQVSRLVELQLRRQELLRQAARTELQLLIDESTLLRSIGSAQVMTRQLAHLLTVGAAPGVQLSIVGLAAARPVLSEPFTILSFPDPADADVVSLTGLRGQVILEQREPEVRALRATFETLARTALSPAQSMDLIRHLLASLPSGVEPGAVR